MKICGCGTPIDDAESKCMICWEQEMPLPTPASPKKQRRPANDPERLEGEMIQYGHWTLTDMHKMQDRFCEMMNKSPDWKRHRKESIIWEAMLRKRVDKMLQMRKGYK